MTKNVEKELIKKGFEKIEIDGHECFLSPDRMKITFLSENEEQRSRKLIDIAQNLQENEIDIVKVIDT